MTLGINVRVFELREKFGHKQVHMLLEKFPELVHRWIIDLQLDPSNFLKRGIDKEMTLGINVRVKERNLATRNS